MRHLRIATLSLMAGLSAVTAVPLLAQPCASPSNIYTFYYDGNTYEVVRQNMNWVTVAACAVERNGVLIEINSVAEQDTINHHLAVAGINNANTVAPDGGGAAYVWTGGNDLAVEGQWIWDGDNNGSGAQFWQGNYTGSAVGGAFINWGSSGVSLQ